MKRILIFLIIIGVPLFCGCATFGTFPNLEKGESTKEDVRSMLGEPAKQVFEDKKEVWEYYFVRGGEKKGVSMRTVMGLTITFEEDEVESYEITVSKRSMQEGVQKELPPPKRHLKSYPPRKHR